MQYLSEGGYEGSSELADRIAWGEQFILGHELIDDQHHALVDAFLASFASIGEELVEPSLSKTFRMFKVQVFLIDWLVNHTLKEDRNYRKYLDVDS